MTYRVTLTRAARRDVGSLPRDVLARVDRVVLSLGADPRPAGVKKFSGAESLYRVRVGDYRIVYQIAKGGLQVLVVRFRAPTHSRRGQATPRLSR